MFVPIEIIALIPAICLAMVIMFVVLPAAEQGKVTLPLVIFIGVLALGMLISLEFGFFEELQSGALPPEMERLLYFVAVLAGAFFATGFLLSKYLSNRTRKSERTGA